MTDNQYPSVYVVDSHVSRPPIPPRLRERPQRGGVAQTLLYLLVSLALCGMVIEACFIYHLYQTESVSSSLPSSSKQISEHVALPSSSDVLPSKPMAHLTGGQDVLHDKEIMDWSQIADPLVFKMTFKDKSLIIQKEGYYFVYSKVYFLDNSTFHHSINMRTERYAGGSIQLLLARKYSNLSTKFPKGNPRSNSYLGGVFHLHKDAALYVKVSDTKKIIVHNAYENVFGAYMI